MAIIQANPGWYIVAPCLQKHDNGKPYYQRKSIPIIAWEIDEESHGVTPIPYNYPGINMGRDSGILEPDGKVTVDEMTFKTAPHYDQWIREKYGWKSFSEVVNAQIAEDKLK